MKKGLQTLLCLLMVLVMGFASIEGVLAEAISPSEDNANSVPADFVDEGNIALEEILQYFTEEPAVKSERADINHKKIEVVFVVDATGSMSSAIANVKRNIASFAQCFSGEQYTLRLGLVEYKDTTVDGMNSTLIHTVGHTPWLDTTSFISELAEIKVDGGGDVAETPIDAMGYLTGSSFAWSSDAYKYAILVTDAGYKVTNRHGIDSLDELGQMLAARNIHTSVITSSSYANMYGDFAAMTGGIVENIYDDFGTTLTEYAYAIMDEVESSATYSIRVLDELTGLPISGAIISGAGATNYTTNAQGIATMELKNSELENLSLSASGYKTIGNIGVRLAQNTIVDLSMRLSPGDSGSLLFDPSSCVNPGKGDDKVAAPKISILGKDVPLFEFPLKMDLWLFDVSRFKSEIDPEKKTLKVFFGPDIKKGFTKTWSETFDAIKDFRKNGFLTSMKANILADVLEEEIKGKQKVALIGEGYVFACLEFSWASEKLEYIDGGFVAALRTGSAEWSYRFVSLPWAYVKFAIRGEIVGKGDISLKNGLFGLFDVANVRIAGRPDFSLNAGAKKAHVGAGVYGDIGANIKLPWPQGARVRDQVSVTVKADGYIEVQFFGFKNRWSLPLGTSESTEFQLYPVWQALPKESLPQAFDLSDFTITPRSSRPFLALRKVALPDAMYKEEYVYSDSRPTILALEDGRTMLLWLKDDTARSSINKSTLVYSIFDGSAWSTPAAIENDGTPDYIYTAKAEGNKVHVLWQDATRAFSDADALQDVVPDVGMSYSVFDGSSFCAPAQRANTGYGMFMPSLALIGDDVTAVWAENSQNDPMLASGSNTLRYAKVTSASWGEASTLASGISQLDDMTAFARNGSVHVAYVEGNAEKAGLMVSAGLNAPKKLYESETIASLQYADDRLFWTDSTSLMSSGNLTGVETEIEGMRGGNFRVIEHGANAAVLFEESNAYANHVGVYYKQGSSWTNPAILAADAGRHELISATLDQDNNIVMAYQYSVMDTNGENPVQSTHLLVSRYEPTAKLVAEAELQYNVFDVAPGAALELTMNVTNEGTAPSTAFDVVLTDELGAELSTKQINESLAIGETKQITFTYYLPEKIQAKTLTAEMRSKEGTVLPGEAVRSMAEIGQGDLALTSLVLTRTDDGAQAVATLRNEGGRAMNQNEVTVKVGGSSGEVVATKSIAKLEPHAETTVTVSIPASRLAANSQYDYKVIRFEVESQSEELISYNNAIEALLDPIAVESMQLNTNTLEMSVGQMTTIGVTCLPTNAANTSVVWHCNNLDVLEVDPATGVIKALREGVATVTAVTEQGNLSDLCTVRVGSGSLSVGGVGIDGPDAVALGSSIVLTAVVQPDTALNKTVQWYCDNANCTLIPGADGTVEVKGAAKGESKITVVTADGGYTCEKTVSVVDGVLIQRQPEDQEVKSGQRAVFSVVAKGEGLTYQWYMLQGKGFAAIDGATASSYTTGEVALEQDGEMYYCQITDKCGITVQTRIATLHVTNSMPSTGDDSTPLLWFAMILLSCMGMTILFTQARKKADEAKE